MFAYEWDTPLFHLKEFVFPGSLGGQLHCFSAVLCLYMPLGKAFTMSLQTHSTRISNIHTNLHIHTFGKTISVNQARTHSRPLGHGPDLKMEVGIDKSTDTRNGSITVSL